MSEKSGKWSQISSAVVISINLLSVMACMCVFALSLWVIAAPSSLVGAIRSFGTTTMKALFTEESLSLQLGVSGALLAGFFFCISFMGLYGAVTGSQFLLFMYATLVVLLLFLECAVAFYLSSNLLEKGIQQQDVHLNHILRTSLQCCEHNRSSPVEVKLPWSCCGVESYPNNCTIENINSQDCQTAFRSWLDCYNTAFYVSLVSFHVILLSCSLVRRCLSPSHT